MRFGAHLPLIGFPGRTWGPGSMRIFAEAARDLGYDTIAANDHLVFPASWLDGLTALASVIDCSGDLALATTISLPVVRGPVALAKTAAAIDVLSGGRLRLGIGPGSSQRDYEAVGLAWEERWPRFDEALGLLKTYLQGGPAFEGKFYSSAAAALEPPPVGRVPLWIGSWGSGAGLRRVARNADLWLASAYNTTPPELAEGRVLLAAALTKEGRDTADFPVALATNWTFVTEDRAEQIRMQEMIAKLIKRPIEQIAERALIGPAAECAAKLRAYRDAGVGEAFVWFTADELVQLERFRRDVVPLVEAP